MHADHNAAPIVMPRRSLRARLQIGLAVLDFIAITTGILAVALLYLGRLNHPRLETFLPLLLPIYYLVAIRYNAFALEAAISGKRSIQRAGFALVTAVVTIIMLSFFFKTSEELSRGLLLAGGTISFLLLMLGRSLFAPYAFARLDGRAVNEVVLVDALPPPDECNAPKMDVRAMGLEPDINDPVMLDRLGKVIDGADRVIVSCRPERRAAWALALKGAGVNVEVLAPELDEMGAITPHRYYGTATALVGSGPLSGVDRLLKRGFDLALTLPAVIILSPLLLLIALIIKLDTPGPALFVQNRVGMGNRLFPMYKFRSMYTNKLDHNASKLTTRNDARVTRIGKIIRATSIDELPQILNVIRGDMSIVGPRPHAVGALAGDALYWEVSSQYWSRHAVKPGLTGLAQVKGFRGNTETSADLINRLQADLDYLEDWSIWRDMALVLKTFGVLVHRNAF